MTDIILQHARRDPVVAVIPLTPKGTAFIKEHMTGGPVPRITLEAMPEVQRLLIENDLEIQEQVGAYHGLENRSGTTP